MSGNPNSPTTGGGNIVKNYVLNTIEALHYALHTTYRKLSNQKARKTNTLNDIKIHSNRSKQKQRVFCKLHSDKQLHSVLSKQLRNEQFPTTISHSNPVSKFTLKHLYNKNYILPLETNPNQKLHPYQLEEDLEAPVKPK